MHKIIISNTSPIFYLYRLGYLELMEQLYGEIVIPNGVIEELKEGGKSGEDVPDIKKYTWIKVRDISAPYQIKIIPDLGKGEAEALALALLENDHLLIIDDLLAREIAKLQMIKFTGTAGVLLKAKKQGLVPGVKPILNNLKDLGFFLSDSVFSNILKLSGEE